MTTALPTTTPTTAPAGARPIFPGRWTGRSAEPFVVLLIGFRINNFWALRKWWSVGTAMPPMIRELRENPAAGLLGSETFLYWRGVVLAQYWRSFDDLHEFARVKGGLHATAWGAFNKAIGSDGSVGIWHETYLIEPGGYEAVYGNMPRFGLAAAVDHVPATGGLETARQRLGGQSEPLFPSPATPGAEVIDLPETADA